MKFRHVLITTILFIGSAQALADDDVDEKKTLADYIKEIASVPFLRAQSNQNVVDIQANGTAIGANTTAHGTNAQAISGNGTAIGTNKTAHGANALAISSNATAISSKAEAQAVSDSLSGKADNGDLDNYAETGDLKDYATSRDLLDLEEGEVENNADNIGVNITDIGNMELRMQDVEINVGIYDYTPNPNARGFDMQGRWALQTKNRENKNMVCTIQFDNWGQIVDDEKNVCVVDKVASRFDDAKRIYRVLPKDPTKSFDWRRLDALDLGDYAQADVNYSISWLFAFHDGSKYREHIMWHEFISRDMNSSHGTIEYEDGDQGQFIMVRFQ